MEKRTSIDWSEHELKTEKDSFCKIHSLILPNTFEYAVKFIHIDGILLVTGDFGRWSFCRDFNPENFDENGISDDYWCGEINAAAVKVEVFDSEGTEAAINEEIQNLLENCEYDDSPVFEDDNEQVEYEFWNDLLDYCENEEELKSYFHSNKPDSIEHEQCPVAAKQHKYLNAIFDAFEEIMVRFETEKKQKNNE